ncbi:MAG: arylesterase [Desulfuromonadales bacterium]|nr:arylesterase [Desulfuromonadales bacterium]
MSLSFLYRSFLMFLFVAVPTFANPLLPDPLLPDPLSPDPFVVLVLGDSLTAGYGLEQDESFPVQLEVRLRSAGYDVNVINAGVSGDTTAGGLARIEWALADQPDIVIVALGANDALRGLDPTQSYKNLDALLTRLSTAECRIILAGMLAPRNLGPEYSARFDQIYPDLAQRFNLLFYPFFLEGVAMDPRLNQADGIHPNLTGVRVIVAGIQPLVITALDEVRVSARVK